MINLSVDRFFWYWVPENLNSKLRYSILIDILEFSPTFGTTPKILSNTPYWKMNFHHHFLQFYFPTPWLPRHLKVKKKRYGLLYINWCFFKTKLFQVDFCLIKCLTKISTLISNLATLTWSTMSTQPYKVRALAGAHLSHPQQRVQGSWSPPPLPPMFNISLMPS